MTTGRRGDTEAKAAGFDATITAGFDWIAEHAVIVLGGVGTLVVVGALTAGIYEYRTSQENDAQFALAQVETRFGRSMGGSGVEVFLPEPANAQQAQRSREEALASLETLIVDHKGSRAAEMAQLRAAEMEADLGRWAEADSRLEGAVRQLDQGDVLRAITLRMLGFVREQRGKFLRAGEAYEEAAGIRSYPAGGSLWISAGASFARAGATDRAINAFQEVLSTAPDLAEQEGVVDRLDALTAAQAWSPPN